MLTMHTHMYMYMYIHVCAILVGKGLSTYVAPHTATACHGNLVIVEVTWHVHVYTCVSIVTL